MLLSTMTSLVEHALGTHVVTIMGGHMTLTMGIQKKKKNYHIDAPIGRDLESLETSPDYGTTSVSVKW
jgi:hypothetical protein